MLALPLAPRAVRAAGELRAGVGRADLTPSLGTPLSGYAARKGAPSTGVNDPIQARALVLDNGATRIGILTADLIGTDPLIVREVAERAGFPPEQLMVCSSHTHSGPGAFSKAPFARIAGGPYAEAVHKKLVAGLAQALRDAETGLRPAHLAVGEAAIPGFQRNRRKAPHVDPALWLLRVDTQDGKPLAALVNLTAHGTVLEEENLAFSGDWMGLMRARMEQDLPGLTVLYTNGAEGDISPNIPADTSNFEGARAHGEKGAAAALTLYRSLQPLPDADLEFRTAMFELPRTLKSAFLGASQRTRLQCFRIRNALLIAVPGEMITELGLLLKEHARRQGHELPVVMGLANDHLGYFLTQAEMKKGGYEAGVSFYGDDFGEKLTLELGRLIRGDLGPLREALGRPRGRAGSPREGRVESREK